MPIGERLYRAVGGAMRPQTARRLIDDNFEAVRRTLLPRWRSCRWNAARLALAAVDGPTVDHCDEFVKSVRSPVVQMLVAFNALLTLPAAAAPREDMIGIPTTYITREPDTLLDIARDYDLGYVETRAANPGVDPWLPGAAKALRLPTQHLLPQAPRHGIVINLPELRLYYFPARGEPRSFPIGIGGEGKETPTGRTQIVAKRIHPTWIPTKSERAEKPDLPPVVAPGPDNPMGDYALYLGWSGYAIHGTDKPDSIGRRDSHGCIRLYPRDIEALYRAASIGTIVTVVNQPAKAGWSGGELYLEVHPNEADADALEAEGAPRSPLAIDADALVLKAAGRAAARLDWYAIHRAELRRDGIPVVVTRPAPPSRQENAPRSALNRRTGTFDARAGETASAQFNP